MIVALVVAACCVCLGFTVRAIQNRTRHSHIPRARDYEPTSNVRVCAGPWADDDRSAT